MKNLIEKIRKLKEEKNAIVLAHSYQNIEIDEVADFVGDSLYLSQKAKETNADIIVFAGVYFMAQTANIISPEKKVLLPNINAGCLMADMINHQQMVEFKKKNPMEQVKGANFVLFNDIIQYFHHNESDKFDEAINQLAIEMKNLQDTLFEKEKNSKRQDVLTIVGLVLSVLFGIMTFIQFFI